MIFHTLLDMYRTRSSRPDGEIGKNPGAIFLVFSPCVILSILVLVVVVGTKRSAPTLWRHQPASADVSEAAVASPASMCLHLACLLFREHGVQAQCSCAKAGLRKMGEGWPTWKEKVVPRVCLGSFRHSTECPLA